MPSAVFSLLLFLLVFFAQPLMAHSPENAPETQRNFTQFSVSLPAGWDGDEQTGFISDNSGEYALTLGKKDDSGDNFIAQISIYLLPNRPGANAEAAAKTLAESQADATEPLQEGAFWTFEGEPRSRTVRGRAKTLVNADKDNLLIIIAQDPQGKEAACIVESLRGLTPEAKRMLGR